MRVAVVYSSKHGFTAECAGLLAEKIHCPTDLYNLKEGKIPDIHQYGLVVMGSAVYAGKIQKEILDLWNGAQAELLARKLYLFTCNMHQGEEGEKQLGQVFPEKLYESAEMAMSFGGKFDFSKMNFLEKMIVKKIAKVDKDVENKELENIEKMAAAINDLCREDSPEIV